MRKRKTLILFIVIVSVLNFVVWRDVTVRELPSLLTVAFLDVGQGDAIFIEAPNGNQMLVDAGRNAKVMQGLAREMSFFDHSIDVIIPTHPDADHIAGMFDVLSRYQVGLAIYSGAHSDTDLDDDLHTDFQKNHVPMIRAKPGEVVDLGSGVQFEILAPAFETSAMTKTNNASIVGRLTYGDTSFLLTGDAPSEVEKYLVDTYGKGLQSNILKVGHHGSKYSSSAIFLQAVDPEYAVISVGAGNDYGHPSQEAIDRIKEEGSKILSTEKRGNIIFQSDGKKIYLLPV